MFGVRAHKRGHTTPRVVSRQKVVQFIFALLEWFSYFSSHAAGIVSFQSEALSGRIIILTI
jgi:hypothetical protein